VVAVVAVMVAQQHDLKPEDPAAAATARTRVTELQVYSRQVLQAVLVTMAVMVHQMPALAAAVVELVHQGLTEAMMTPNQETGEMVYI
jgi:hypothetical protein